MDRTQSGICPLILTLLLALTLSGCGGGSSGGGGSSSDGGSSSSDGDDNGNDVDAGDTDDDADSITDLAHQIHQLDVSGAQGFVITDGAAEENQAQQFADTTADTHGTRQHVGTEFDPLTHNESNLDAATLYKVTNDGRLEAVSYQDEDGNELPRGSFEPAVVMEMGLDFLYVGLVLKQFYPDNPDEPEGPGWYEEENLGVLVNKSTGLAFLTGEAFGKPFDMAVNVDPLRFTNQVRTDPDGNLYFIRWLDNELMRVDIGNLGQGDLSAQAVINLPHTQEGFEMPVDSNMLVYRGRRDDGSHVYMAHDLINDESMTLRSIDGLFDDSDAGAAIRGLDGELYLVYDRSAGDHFMELEYELIQLTRDAAGQLNGQSMGTLEGQFASGEPDRSDENRSEVLREFMRAPRAGFDTYTHGRQVVGGRLMYFHGGSDMFEVDLANQRVISHDLAYEPFGDEPSYTRTVIPTERYVWIGGFAQDGSPIIVRYNPVNSDVATFEFDQNFEVASFDPMGDRIVFEGIRFSDGATVVGEMTVEGETLNTEVYEASPVSIHQLRAITPADVVRVDGDPRDWDLDHRVLFGIEGSGPAGSDLLYYSQLQGRDEYLGLVEFAGRIDSEHHTRIGFDTHNLVINPAGVSVSAGDDEPDLVSDARVGQGQALEFAVTYEAFGGTQPILEEVERFELVRYGAVDVHEEEGNDQTLELEVTFESPLGEQTVVIPLSDTESLEIAWNEVSLLNDQDRKTLSIEFPEQDQAWESINISIDVDDLDDPDAIYEELDAENPEGVLLEETLDTIG